MFVLARLALIGATVAVLVTAGPGSIALADNIHLYSVGADSANSGAITGVYSSHSFVEISAPSTSSDCSIKAATNANAVYRSQWVYHDNNNQIEYGIAENCGGQAGEWVYRYAFWLDNGVGNFVSPNVVTLPGPDSTAHTFSMYRNNNQWTFLYDGFADPWPLNFPMAGTWAEAGIESNNASTVVPNHWFSNLNATANEGPYYAWGAAPGTLLNNPPCCGFFRSSQQWSGAENSTCN